ncbi:hypothetical protein BKA81DRAFT_205632 [Phyllosticta paracitricarpa]
MASTTQFSLHHHLHSTEFHFPLDCDQLDCFVVHVSPRPRSRPRPRRRRAPSPKSSPRVALIGGLLATLQLQRRAPGLAFLWLTVARPSRIVFCAADWLNPTPSFSTLVHKKRIQPTVRLFPIPPPTFSSSDSPNYQGRYSTIKFLSRRTHAHTHTHTHTHAPPPPAIRQPQPKPASDAPSCIPLLACLTRHRTAPHRTALRPVPSTHRPCPLTVQQPFLFHP